MALYHFSVKTISRMQGRSAIACAAYRSAKKLICDYYGKEQDYTKKSGVEFTEIYAPEHTNVELLDRQKLWNEVEKVERRKDALLAREFEIAFPCELNAEQRKQLLHELCLDLVEKYNVVIDAAIHAPHKKNGSDERNFHAHIMFTTRSINEHGEFSAKKYRDFSRDYGTKTVSKWRESFARLCNQHLELNGFDTRVDHRSYKVRELELEATQHEGPIVTQLRRKGIDTEISLKNDAIKKRRIEREKDNKKLIHVSQDIEIISNNIINLKEENSAIKIAQKRVTLFPKIYENFLNEWNSNEEVLQQSIVKQIQLLEKHDIYEISMQYTRDFELLKKYCLEPRPTFWKKLKNTFSVSAVEKTYIDIVNNNLNDFFPTCFEEYGTWCKAEATKKEQLKRKKIEDQERIEHEKWLDDQKQKRELQLRQEVELMLNQNYAKNLDYELEQSSYFSNTNYLIRNIETELHFIANKKFDDYKRSVKGRYSEFSELFSLNNKITSLNESIRIKILKLVDDDKKFIEKHCPSALSIIVEFQTKVGEKYERRVLSTPNVSNTPTLKPERDYENDFSI
ncbi:MULTISPECIES: MobQ family relaxase [unclassified Acinetobacter]|uniref:MobQ family relaxase n=1 Tax=unclassified Acinetobacter TaxID=196816 RepID=UPI001C22227F|nr:MULTISPECIES: MobQ family relaxase [unclassified Acinetobacter]